MAGQIGCAQITSGVVGVDCGHVPSVGTIGNVALFNYNQIDQSLLPTSYNIAPAYEDTLMQMPLRIQDATTTPPTPFKGYFFETVDDATVGEVTLNAGTYFNTWQHQIVLRLFTKDQACKQFIRDMRNGRVVALIENKDWGLNGLPTLTPDANTVGTTKYEVYGINSGLILTEATVSTEMADGVTYQVTLASGTAKESNLPLSIVKLDAATPFSVNIPATVTYLNSVVTDGRF